MKYLIAGTGGVGGSIAGFLSLAGKDVTCIARGAHLQSIQTNGLKLKSDLKGEHTLQIKATSPMKASLRRKSIKILSPVAAHTWRVRSASHIASRVNDGASTPIRPSP